MKLKKGFFITFEGIDGSGKTTIIKHLRNKLSNVNIEFSREPGGNSNICEKIRDILFENPNNNIDKYTEALLFAASRSAHYNGYIKEKLLQGKIIICDRFLDSSIVYQGICKNLGTHNIETINRFAIKEFNPDLTFYFDISFDNFLSRLKNNIKNGNYLDKFAIEHYQEITSAYKDIISRNLNRYVIIDANQSISGIIDDIIKHINEYLKKNNYEELHYN